MDLQTDFREKKPTAPAPSARTAASSIQGLPLMSPGAIVKDVALTAYEKEQLAKVGWKEGDAIPKAALQEQAMMLAAQKMIREESNTITDADVSRHLAPHMGADGRARLERQVDFDDLSAAQKQQLMAATKDAERIKAEIDLQAAQRQMAQAMDPSVRQVFEQTLREPVVIDDRSAAQPTAEQPAPKPAPQPEPQPQSSAPPIGTMSDTGAVGITKCQHCGSDLAAPSVAEPSDRDKLSFLQSMLGSTRFEKTYVLFNGVTRVTFRSLTAQEADLAHQQLAYDMLNGDVGTRFNQVMSLQSWRFCMSLARLEGIPGMQTNVGSLPCVLDMKCDKNNADGLPQTVLVPWRAHLYEVMLTSESLRRVLSGIFLDFERLVSKLEMNVLNPDFWKGIDEQA